MASTVHTVISERIAGNIKAERKARKWSMNTLSKMLAAHRCGIHTDDYPFDMSVQVINSIENGVPPQHGHKWRTRPVTSDELHVFAEVFETTVMKMMS